MRPTSRLAFTLLSSLAMVLASCSQPTDVAQTVGGEAADEHPAATGPPRG